MDLTESNEEDIVLASGDENEERGNWTGKFDFILSCIGYAVGLGNVWRFPHLCYKNGGGAFIIPYLVMLAIAGLPLFFFELSFGQFSNLGPLTIWRVSPMFKGIGYSMIIISTLVCIYYNIIIAWSFYYFFVSLNTQVPWTTCDNSWNYPGCVTNFTNLLNATDSTKPCQPSLGIKANCTSYSFPAEQFWLGNVLTFVDNTGKSIQFGADLGPVNYKIALCLLLSWILVCLCLIKGVKSSGKVVYFTAIFPYVVIIIMVINGALLDGSFIGIDFYMRPKWEKLLVPQVWADAATQIFYSLGVAFGSLITMASYNRFKNNCYRDAIIVTTINCFTSIFAGFAIFSVLGYMSKQTGVLIEDVTTSGSGLAFVAYAEGIARMKVAPLWAVLFFIMLLTLGLDSQFGMLEAVLSGLEDEFKFLSRNKITKYGFKIAICVALFLLGLPMCCSGGMYYFTLLDNYSGGVSLMITCFAELIVISYIYGIKNFVRDIGMMVNWFSGMAHIYWLGCWMFITPIVILAILVFSLYGYTTPKYNGIPFPEAATSLGWCMTAVSVSAIPIYFLYYLIRFGFTLAPEDAWGPAVEKYWSEDERYAFKLNRVKGIYNEAYDEPTKNNREKYETDFQIAKF